MSSVLLVQSNARRIPLQDQSVSMCVTSPPYFALRSYGIGAAAGELGSEPLHDCNGAFTGENCGECYICHMREVFREVHRVVRDDGVLFVNVGDTYNSNPSWGRGHSTLQGRPQDQMPAKPADGWKQHAQTNRLKSKDLMMIPARLALALQADGWTLRSEIIWCLSGGTWVYARTKKGDMPITIKDIARLKPSSVQLWNGHKWTQLLGMSRSPRQGTEIEFVLRSGERISCTPTHQFPTQRGLVQAGELRVGDALQRVKLPEPDDPLNPKHIDTDAAWLAGLYTAEGSRSEDMLQIAGHIKEEERWERVQRIALAYGGVATRSIAGNNMNIRLYGKFLNAIIDHFVTGKTAKDKGIAPVLFRYGNPHLAAWLEGYCGGDGHWDAANQRWRLGFTRNYNLERDLRTICARLGYHLTLKLSHAQYHGQSWPCFRGELRTHRNGHGNEKDTGEIVAIQKARCREVWDLGVADEPHLFALASGILTHNSKVNPMPESATDRPTKAHEQVYLFSKQERYFYDAEAVKEEATYGRMEWRGNKYQETRHADPRDKRGFEGIRSTGTHYDPSYGRNLRSVWSLATEPYAGAHYACFPQALVERCIKAGSSEAGCCAACGAPLRRDVETQRLLDGQPFVAQAFSHPDEPYRPKANGISHMRYSTRILVRAWERSCRCTADIVPCIVLDPFCGSGTSLLVARTLGRHGIGCDLSLPYLRDQARHRLSLDALASWEGRHGHVPPEDHTTLPLFAGGR